MQPLKHALVNTGDIVSQFCALLTLSTLFPGLARCFTPVFTYFDGTGDYCATTEAISDTDGPLGTVSMLYTPQEDGAASGVRALFRSNDGLDFRLDHNAGDLIFFRLQNAAGTNILRFTSTSTYTVADGPLHILISWNQDASPTHTFKVNGVDAGHTVLNNIQGDADYSSNGVIGILGTAVGGSLNDCCLSELYINTVAEITDATLFANGNQGINLGAQGELPSGSQPKWYIPNLLTGTNLGSLSNLTVNGDPQTGCP